ncbi:LacI family DNA-binding transcriptional regulator [Paenibacillus antri]|nr:LacI family DNA-binding transcriptional regulator [Paenibacillus antri]
MGPTIHDVARLAGTSKSTVSRYLNGQQVKKATQDALEKAIAELNYHRNAHARRLVMNKTYTIGIVIDDISNIFYSGMIKGIEAVARRNGYNCIFLSWTSNFDKETSFLNYLYEGQVDGLILASFRKRNEEDVRAIRDAGYPIALIGDHCELEGVFSVDVDNAAGIEEVVTYLHGIGHRRIGYISGQNDLSASKYRYKGYRRTMEALGMPVREEWVVESDWTNQGGYEAMRRLAGEADVTAVVVSSDEAAIGALRALKELGRSVPRELSVAGFDDIPVAGWVDPALTTVRQPFRDIGTLAAEGLFRKIEGTENTPRSHLLRPKFIVRDSCGPAEWA